MPVWTQSMGASCLLWNGEGLIFLVNFSMTNWSAHIHVCAQCLTVDLDLINADMCTEALCFLSAQSMFQLPKNYYWGWCWSDLTTFHQRWQRCQGMGCANNHSAKIPLSQGCLLDSQLFLSCQGQLEISKNIQPSFYVGCRELLPIQWPDQGKQSYLSVQWTGAPG